MKKFMIFATAILTIVGAAEAKRVPEKVQGVPYAQTLKKAKGTAMPAWEWDPNPDSPALPENEFTFDDIQSWSGEGSKKAALVIQWNDPRETHALVFGYRWDGLATGADMIRAVVADNPRLYGLIQYTNVSSPTDPLGGYTINGFGWDADADGDIELFDSGYGDYYTSETGLFIHPRGYNPDLGGSSDYDYDNWETVDADDFWQAGWYIGYWSYWVKDSSEANFGYSGWGASGRVLEDGSWDGWNYAVDMMASDWKEFKAAPSSIPEGAKTEFEVDGLYFSLTDFNTGKVRLVNPSELTTIENPVAYTGEINIPSEFVDGEKTYTVTEIKDGAFKDATITTVTLPSTITKIGANAFENSSLSSIKGEDDVNIAETVTALGAFAFDGCENITTFFLPDALTAIPDGLYKGCGIATLTIPENVTNIGASAFEGNSSLTSVEIPQSVVEIGSRAFDGCNSIQTITVSTVFPPNVASDSFGESVYSMATLQIPTGFEEEYKAKDVWKEFTNISFINLPVNNGDIFALNNVTFRVDNGAGGIGNEGVIITYPKIDGKPTRDNIKAANTLLEGDIIIPDRVNYMGQEFAVKAMNDSAFYGASNITSIVINAKIEKIPNQAFYECSKLENVSLQEGLKSIGEYAFSYSGIKHLTLPQTVETLGERAFFQCIALESINIPSGLTAVPRYCFSYCKALTSLSFGNQIESIGEYALQNCSSLTSVTLPEKLTAIPNYMFSNCVSLENVTIPETVTSLGASVFNACNKLKVTLPNSIESLGSSALSGVANEEIILPYKVTTLPYGLFSGCPNLQKVVLSDNVTAFENSVFQNCSKLTTLSIMKDEAEGYSLLGEETVGINFPSKLTSLGNYCFQGCLGITSVSIPEGVTKVGQSLFYRCSNLQEVALPNSLTTLQTGMFQECKALKKVTLGGSISSIPQNFVRDCNELESIVIKGREDDAVVGKLVLPETVTTIGSWTFANCQKLREAIIPSKVTNLQMNTFDGCSSLAKVYLPDGLTSIGNYVFRNTSLTELELPANAATGYSSDIVYGCNGITIYVCNSAAPKSIGANAFRISSGKYASIMVPLGKKETYENTNNWKQSVISQPSLALSFEGEELENSNNESAEVSIEMFVDFNENLPARFRALNEDVLLDEAQFELHWRLGEEIVQEESNGARRIAKLSEFEDDSEDEGDGSDKSGFERVSIEFNSDNNAVVSIERPEMDSMLETKLHAIHTSGEYVTPITNIALKGSGIQTGIVGIENDYLNSEELLFDLNGLKVTNPERGVYIRLRNGKNEKIRK